MNLKLVIGLLTVLVLTACSEAPPCPDFKASPVVTSAGCVAYQGQSLLLVQGQNDAVSVPGGSANQGESGAVRLFVKPGKKPVLWLSPNN